MPKCRKCGKDIPRSSKFCNHCGARQSKGTLYLRSDGLYEKILRIDGKRVAFRAKTEEAVFQKILKYEEKQENGYKFSEVAEMWEKDNWETLSPTTQRGYKFALKEIKERFGDKYIRKISHKDISSYIKGLPRSYAKKTCQTRLILLNNVFKYAITEDLLENNPCEYITINSQTTVLWF